MRVSPETARSFKRAADKIAKMSKGMAAVNANGLRLIGEEIMTDIRANGPGRGVPEDEGTLRGTGRVDGPILSGGQPHVILSFGGPAAPYALVQHEHLEYNHTVGEARYLVRGLERWRSDGSAAWAAVREHYAAAVRAAART